VKFEDIQMQMLHHKEQNVISAAGFLPNSPKTVWNIRDEVHTMKLKVLLWVDN
jgi:hypothetical protein